MKLQKSPPTKLKQATGRRSPARPQRLRRGQDSARIAPLERRARNPSGFVKRHRQTRPPKPRPIVWELEADLPVTKREIQMLAALVGTHLSVGGTKAPPTEQ
jgi:hypothetical protein